MSELQLSEPLYAPSAEGALDHLFSSRDGVKKKIEDIAGFMDGPARLALNYCVEGAKHERERYGLSMDDLLDVSRAVKALDADYWNRAMELTDVRECMPQARRSEWHELISKHATPEFVPENVIPTFQELLGSRSKFFAERVDGVFRALSRSHVTNQPEGFGKRMILNYVLSEYGMGTNYEKVGYIHDLRCVIARFMGRDEPEYSLSDRMVRTAAEDPGKWITVDGGALRLRVYAGVRTGHLEVHPDMAWRLNAVLASLYPAAIPSQFREPPKRKVRDFALMQKPLPFAVLSLLRGLHGSKENDRYLALGYTDKPDKSQRKRLGEVLAAIGGVESGGGWAFDYSPQGVINQIICSGCIPDQQSHQFYPTPEFIAQEAVSEAMAGHTPGMRWLEPSAGTGNLASLFPADAMVTCYDISALHVAVLNARGLLAIEHDFLKTSLAERYDRIVMNPPYSEGRWRAHVEHAASKLLPGGRLVAILPESARGKRMLPGWAETWGDAHDNAFAGASVSVAIYVGRKP